MYACPVFPLTLDLMCLNGQYDVLLGVDDMKTKLRIKGDHAYFVITELDERFHNAAEAMFYNRVEDGFAKRFPTNTPRLDNAYWNFEKYIEEVILQMAGVHPVPWEKSLLAFLDVVEAQDIDWWLTGSAALTVRGLDIVPHDFDIVVDAEGAHKLGELLSDYVFEPVVDCEGWFFKWFGRAFLHARIEWVGAVNDSADEPEVSEFGPTAASSLETAYWREHEIRVPPLRLQLRHSERRGLTDRVRKIKTIMDQS